MLPKIASIVMLTTTTSTVALSLPHNPPYGMSNTQCSTGPVQCCESIAHPGSANHASMLQTLNGVRALKDLSEALQGNAFAFGVECMPFSAWGAGFESSCQGETVCCDHTANGGNTGVNCTPFNVNV